MSILGKLRNSYYTDHKRSFGKAIKKQHKKMATRSIPQTCAELKSTTSHSVLITVTPDTHLDKCLMAMVENDVSV